MPKISKTNAMRMLDRAKIKYEVKEYLYEEDDLSGIHIADENHIPVNQLFKTILLKGDKSGYLVACLEADKEIDLKKISKLSNNKSTELVPVKDLEKITGYIRGGCSPIGMKKVFPTFSTLSMADNEIIYVSAGQRGLQIVINPKDLISFCHIELGDISF